MKVVVAADSFKGSLDAPGVVAALAEGFLRAVPEAEVDKVPIADGGEGTVRALVDATGGHIVPVEATGPLGDTVEAFFGVLGDGATGVIEMAAASGLPLVPPERRDPRTTTTRGTGELIRAALDWGCRRLIVGIGGSATNDGGVGMAQALGASFRNGRGEELGPGGGALTELAEVDLSGLDPRLGETEIVVACDVDNPLVGPHGASAVYGPQKGATPEIVAELDAALSRLAAVIERQTGIDIASLSGGGAAGGLGAGLVAFCGGRLEPGIDIILEAVGLERRLQGASLVLTGEGAIDGQTAHGKAPSGVAKIARKWGVPVVAVAGSVGDDAAILYQYGFDAIVSCTPRPMTLAEAMQRTRASLAEAGETIGRLVRTGAGIAVRAQRSKGGGSHERNDH